MLFDGIDHMSFCPAEPQLMLRAVKQIGWNVVPWRDGWALTFGSAPHFFQVWVQPNSISETGVREIGLRVTDLDRVISQLSERGVFCNAVSWRNSVGEKIADVALLSTLAQAGINIRLIQWTATQAERFAMIKTQGVTNQQFPVKRLDHLAIITHDLDVKSQFWEDVFGVPKHGIVRSSNMIIHQYKIGDAIIELLGPTNDQSTLMKRIPGPAPMFSVEVANLAQSVELAVLAGFPAPAPTEGVLPMTQTSTIPFEATGGLNWQLLQYV